ncbi:hypothetical protein [Helicobacter cappadocius]|uniref:Uncharacterized protein n=1 Tax=Helicobacter cappadocius TaxID=3063998 RepID=A0AA90Q2H9_9HELI|nr:MULTISPECIES: hypothetical protein [unclassified Helicobacter]MDO7252890.1 hypothetical protein [Helicobacter sp. faydin-H75]MDP2538933.1 hypothetical protein [Helicobacter sp. faydin-H76]
MDLKNIIESRDRQIHEYRDLIMSLDDLNDLDETKNLKYFLHCKKDLLVSLNVENYQDVVKKLEIINEKIYISSNILRNKITGLRCGKFNPTLQKLTAKDNKLKFADIINLGINHQFISTFIFFLIGGFVFSIYFLEIGYFPTLNKESFIYFLFLLSSIGILYTFLFLFIPIIVQKIFLKIFNIQYINKNKKNIIYNIYFNNIRYI